MKALNPLERDLRRLSRRCVAAAPAVLGDEWSEPEIQRQVAKLGQAYEHLLIDLAYASAKGSHSAWHLRNRVLGSKRALAACLIAAAARREVKLSLAAVRKVAASLSPWAECGEPIGVHF